MKLAGWLTAMLGAGALGVVGAPAASAMTRHDEGPMVSIVGTVFDPDRTDVLAGDTVMWHNESVLRHTVTAVDGSFASATLLGGDMFERRFDTPGVVKYYCTLHAFMNGEVDVHRVLLDAPRQPVAPGSPYQLSGRAALPAGSAVAIERDAGSGFAPVGNTAVAADGRFTLSVRSRATARFRAVAGGDTSPAVRLVVVHRKVRARTAGRGRRAAVIARVTPAAPGATVVLQLRLRNRFGWWPVARKRLDRHSQARFPVGRLRHRVRARVVLTLADGATQLARSAVVRVGPRR